MVNIWLISMTYPQVICDIAIENGHRNCELFFPLRMLIFHRYLILPKGIVQVYLPETFINHGCLLMVVYLLETYEFLSQL